MAKEYTPPPLPPGNENLPHKCTCEYCLRDFNAVWENKRFCVPKCQSRSFLARKKGIEPVAPQFRKGGSIEKPVVLENNKIEKKEEPKVVQNTTKKPIPMPDLKPQTTIAPETFEQFKLRFESKLSEMGYGYKFSTAKANGSSMKEVQEHENAYRKNLSEAIENSFKKYHRFSTIPVKELEEIYSSFASK